MKQIKTFDGWDIDEVKNDVNEWLEEEDENITNIKEHKTHRMKKGKGTLTTISILYECKERID